MRSAQELENKLDRLKAKLEERKKRKADRLKRRKQSAETYNKGNKKSY